jgi:BolA protein
MRPAIADIQARLQIAFPEAAIEVIDDSHLHAGHAGAQGGAGHFTVNIAWPGFAGKLPLARHRLVYDALADWIPDRIHALSIRATS